MVTTATDSLRPVRADQPRAAAAPGAPDAATLDCAAIMHSAGEVPYEWRIDTDGLIWGAGAPALLGLRDTAPVATGRGFAKLLDPGNAQTRFDAITHAAEADTGAGVPLSGAIRNALRSALAQAVDRGYRPLVRGRRRQALEGARRHPRHQRSLRARAAARLSVALRSTHRRDQPLASDRAIVATRCRRPSA